MVGAIDSRQPGHLCCRSDIRPSCSTRWPNCRRPPARRSPMPPGSTNAMCGSGWAVWSPAVSSTTTPASQTYSLPRHRAAVLTRAAGPDNLSRVAQFIPMLGEVEQKIIGCFHNGGGLPYSEYPRFHKLMAEQSGEVFDAALVDVVLPMAEGLPDRLRAGADVADIGCGSGHAINVMAQAFPASRFTGIDFSDEGLAVGAAEARSLGLTNAAFRQARRGRARRGRSLRRHNGFRRDPRPGPAGAGVAQHLSRVAAGRGAADGRHQGVESPRGQHRRAAWLRTCTPFRRCTA